MTPTTIRASAAARWTSLGEVPATLGPTVVALGVFDGLHRGHAHLLAAARTLAAARRLPLVLVTFDPHPATIAGPKRDTTAIVSVDERIRLARRHGADHVLVLPFDNDLAAVPAEDFVRTVLLYSLHAVHIVVGDLPAATRILGRPLRLEGRVVNGRVDVDPCLLLPPPGDYHAQIDDKFTMITIRADRTVWVLGHPDGPITVGLVRAA